MKLYKRRSLKKPWLVVSNSNSRIRISKLKGDIYIHKYLNLQGMLKLLKSHNSASTAIVIFEPCVGIDQHNSEQSMIKIQTSQLPSELAFLTSCAQYDMYKFFDRIENPSNKINTIDSLIEYNKMYHIVNFRAALEKLWC